VGAVPVAASAPVGNRHALVVLLARVARTASAAAALDGAPVPAAPVSPWHVAHRPQLLRHLLIM